MVYNNEVDTYGTVKVEAASFVFMVEMVDTPDLKSCAFKRPSSILGEDTSAPQIEFMILSNCIMLMQSRKGGYHRYPLARVNRVSTVGTYGR